MRDGWRCNSSTVAATVLATVSKTGVVAAIGVHDIVYTVYSGHNDKRGVNLRTVAIKHREQMREAEDRDRWYSGKRQTHESLLMER